MEIKGFILKKDMIYIPKNDDYLPKLTLLVETTANEDIKCVAFSGLASRLNNELKQDSVVKITGKWSQEYNSLQIENIENQVLVGTNLSEFINTLRQSISVIRNRSEKAQKKLYEITEDYKTKKASPEGLTSDEIDTHGGRHKYVTTLISNLDELDLRLTLCHNLLTYKCRPQLIKCEHFNEIEALIYEDFHTNHLKERYSEALKGLRV